MRFGPPPETRRRLFLALALICTMGTIAEGQELNDWQSLARLQPGDKIHLSLKAGPVKNGSAINDHLPTLSRTRSTVSGGIPERRRGRRGLAAGA